MIELKGNYTDCKIFTDQVEETAITQVKDFLNHIAFKDCRTRFMPDIHAGKGSVIGTTVELSGMVIPNVIGVDIGCGMLSAKIGKIDIDLAKLDEFISNNIPSGQRVNPKEPFSTAYYDSLRKDILKVCNKIELAPERVLHSLGTLGGGNHFIELGVDEEENKWLTIHSGSRNFGLKVAKYHTRIAEKSCKNKKVDLSNIPLKNRESYLKSHKPEKIQKGMEYLVGSEANDYLNDMRLAQEYASFNRKSMIEKIINHLNIKVYQWDRIESVHNYINFTDNIIRKGAISAHEEEFVVIPWNMRDGLIIGVGLGNEDWNYSAPHGAGRNFSRTKAFETINLEDFEESMKGIYSTSVVQANIDESPFAYKDYKEVEKHLSETVEIIHRVKPIYNFKAK